MLFVLVLVFYFRNHKNYIGVTKTTVDKIEICDAYFSVPENDQQYLDIPSWSGVVVFSRFLVFSCISKLKRATFLSIRTLLLLLLLFILFKKVAPLHSKQAKTV